MGSARHTQPRGLWENRLRATVLAGECRAPVKTDSSNVCGDRTSLSDRVEFSPLFLSSPLCTARVCVSELQELTS